MTRLTYIYTDTDNNLHVRSLSEEGELGRDFNSGGEEIGYYETDIHTHIVDNFQSELLATLESPNTASIQIINPRNHTNERSLKQCKYQ